MHDLWRFHQNDWNIVLDNKDFDHWDKSYELVKNKGYCAEVCLAIKYHNKFSIDSVYVDEEYLCLHNNEKKKTIFLLKILRDADMLQNMLYSISNIEDFFSIDKSMSLWDWDISPSVMNDFVKLWLVNKWKVKTFWDYYLYTLAFIFWINFEETLQILYSYWYIDIFISKIKNLSWISKKSIDTIEDSINTFRKPT